MSDLTHTPCRILRLLLVIPGISLAVAHDALAGKIPAEPVEIGTVPQFFVDDAIVDNRFAIRYKRESVVRRFHQPTKHAGNPIIRGDGGILSTIRDAKTGRFRMWYQSSTPRLDAAGKRLGSLYAISYAESKDGMHWTLPTIGRFEWKGTKQNNVVYRGISGKRASAPCLLELPEKDRRGFRYLMLYRTGGAGKGKNGIRIVGSQDGTHWDLSSDTLIAELHSDTLNSLVYDPVRKRYRMYCRAKHIYRTFRGPILNTGASRRIALMSNDKLWTRWKAQPQNILIPDEIDAARRFNFFYGMPVKYHAGIFWGFVWSFKMNDDIIPELATSRDGVNFDRHPLRPWMLELGPKGAWDHGMILPGAGWVEVGDEWWIYYSGWSGPHGRPEARKPGIGVAKIRKEGFVSLHGPKSGGVVITRRIRWPGGKLVINADARNGELKVRVSDEKRKPIPGFDYDDCDVFQDDGVAHTVTWKKQSIESLKGKVIRLEIFLKNAELYTFRATGNGG